MSKIDKKTLVWFWNIKWSEERTEEKKHILGLDRRVGIHTFFSSYFIKTWLENNLLLHL